MNTAPTAIATRRCYGAQADDCDQAAEYHALTDWSVGPLYLCRDCVAWEREVDGLIWVHTLRPECGTNPGQVPVVCPRMVTA